MSKARAKLMKLHVAVKLKQGFVRRENPVLGNGYRSLVFMTEPVPRVAFLDVHLIYLLSMAIVETRDFNTEDVRRLSVWRFRSP
jgi:hypothetical protein